MASDIFQLTPRRARGLFFGHEYELKSPGDTAITFILRPAMDSEGVEPPCAGGRSLLCLWRRIKSIPVYGARAGFISVLPHRSLFGNGSGMAVGRCGRGHHRGESRRLLSGGPPHVVTFPAGFRFPGNGGSGFSVSSVLAVDSLRDKAARKLTAEALMPRAAR